MLPSRLENVDVMRDWRKPSVKLRNFAKGVGLRGLQAAGRLRTRSAAETATVQTDVVEYFGDVPGPAGALTVHAQRRVLFQHPPPTVEHLQDVHYSAAGMAWVDGVLHEKYSARYPSLKEAASFPGRGSTRTLEAAVIVESDYLYSYGDWLHTYLVTCSRKTRPRGSL